MSLNLEAQVAKLEERIDNAKEHIGDKLDGLEDKISLMVTNQEEFWKEFRRSEKAVLKNFEDARAQATQLGVVILSNKKHCDDRFEILDKEKRQATVRARFKAGAIITVITSSATVLTNLGIAAIKIKWGIA